MTNLRRDLLATGLTVLVVLVYAANVYAWPARLVGDSVRWAATVIFVLGLVTCAIGSAPDALRRDDHVSIALAVAGSACAVLAAIAIVTGWGAALAALVVADVALWLGTTARHLARHHRQSTPAPV